jgi:kinesin family protein 4/21/27
MAAKNADSVSVRVAVRVRPLLTKERNEGCGECLRVETNHVVLRNDKTFAFDAAFDSGAAQQAIYEQTAAPLVRKCFEGFNGTVFAYGQTGSGKTHTMGGSFEEGFQTASGGPGESAGVIPRVVHQIFETIAKQREADPSVSYTVTLSFLEIYNECIRDLLAPAAASADAPASLDLREDPQRGGVVVAGLSAEPVTSEDQVYACLQRGGLRRATASTQMNAQSSRSHAICTIGLERRGGGDGGHRWARLNLVDLAGSERQKRTKAEGVRLTEAININKGLFVLGNVISALGDERQAGAHVPYRNSKLTRLLQDSLGGNSHTVMIACCSPADSNFEETVNTLRYAHRARNIQNSASVNKDPAAAELQQLRQQVQLLQLRLLGSGGQTGPGANGSSVMQDMAQVVEALDMERLRCAKLDQALEAASRESAELLAERDRKTLQLEQCQQQLVRLGHTPTTEEPDASSGQSSILEQQLGTITDLRQQLARATTAAATSTSASFEAEAQVTTADVGNSNMDSEFEQEQRTLAANLASLDASLEQKQELMKALASSNTSMAAVAQAIGANAAHCGEAAETQQQQKIHALVSERDALQKQLRFATTSSGSTTAQRQRLTALEDKLSQAQLKLRELSRLRRLTEQAGANVKRLQSEIDAGKRQRAEVQRRMHEAAMAHGREQKQRKHELGQWQRKDQQKQVRLQRLEMQHTRQGNVLQRKEEQIAAVTRRLRAVLEQQKAASAPKAAGQDAGVACKALVQREIDVAVTLKLAKQALARETEARADAASRLCVLQQDTEVESDDVAELQDEVRERTALIAQLQDRLANFDTSKHSQLWSSAHTVREAKLRIRKVFEAAVEGRIRLSSVEQAECEAQALCERVEGEKQEALAAQRAADQNMLELQQQCDAKLLLVLQNVPVLNGAPGGELPQGGDGTQLKALRDEQIESLGDLHERMCISQQETAAENDTLRQRIATLSSTAVLPAGTKKAAARASKKAAARNDSESDYEDWEESDEDEQWEDDSEDSDYEERSSNAAAQKRKPAHADEGEAEKAAPVVAAPVVAALDVVLGDFEAASAALSKLTVAQLKDQLRNQNLKVSGLKGELVLRLLEHRGLAKDAQHSKDAAAEDASLPSPDKPLAPRVAQIIAHKHAQATAAAAESKQEQQQSKQSHAQSQQPLQQPQQPQLPKQQPQQPKQQPQQPKQQPQQPPQPPHKAAQRAKAPRSAVQELGMQQAARCAQQAQPTRALDATQLKPRQQQQPQPHTQKPQLQTQPLRCAVTKGVGDASNQARLARAPVASNVAKSTANSTAKSTAILSRKLPHMNKRPTPGVQTAGDAAARSAKLTSALAVANNVASSVAKLQLQSDASMREKLAKFAAQKKQARAGEENSRPSTVAAHNLSRPKFVPKQRPHVQLNAKPCAPHKNHSQLQQFR